MNRSIDLSGLEPLLRLLREEPPEIAIAAVEAAVRFPLTDDAWRALAQETARLLHETDETTPDRERLISAAASIPVRSVRLRLHGITENGAPQDRDRAFRALAEVGDPEVASIIVRTLEESSAEDWYWGMSRLARMPIEATNLSLEDLPVADEAFPDVRFWQALVFARLGSMNALEPVLRGHVDPPGFVWGSPWLAYAELARVRPLPEPVQAHILDMFGLRSAGEVDRDALDRAGLIVWGLTGVADAEGSPIEGAPGAEASREEAVVWSEAEVALAERAAQEILGNFEGLVDEQVDTAPLRALPPGKVGGFVHALLRIAHDFVRSMEGVPPFVVSNPVVRAISSLPRADLPVALIFEEWKAAAQSGVDPEQLAWILERGGAEQVIAAAARSKDPDFLIILSSVGDVAAGTAGSPWRGSSGGGSSGERQEIIEDIGWAESAPPPVEEVASSRGAGPPPPAASRESGAPPPPPPGGTGGEPPSGDSTAFKAVLSAEGPDELDVGQEAAIQVRVEHEAGAQPLAHAATVTVQMQPISVMLFLSNEFVQLRGPVLQQVDPPRPDQPIEITFPIVAHAPGETRAIVHFQQGTTTLAMLTFTTRVVASGATAGTTVATGAAAQPDPYDDGVVRILIQQPTSSDPCYSYFVTSKLLGLVNKHYKSPSFDEDGDATDRPKEYAKSIYNKIEKALLERTSDARALETRLERIGREMCARLFPESLVRELWKHRERIQSIEITPVEPYIPWELLRLEHPEEGVDSRHLSEYRLVRVLGGREPARLLGRSEWRYVLGEYPNQLYSDLPDERVFLTSGLPSLGVAPVAVPSRLEDILDVVDPADFDVMHFACHGEASLDEIDDSALIVADRFSVRDQKPVAVKVYPSDMKVNLSPRRPLIFLSACQSGRMAPSLTDFGGWPKVFVDAQAGALVGTSWEVHEKPAVAFANAFYASLLRGETLGEAAGAARTAARALRDASWLAYTVYGWSSARMSA